MKLTAILKSKLFYTVLFIGLATAGYLIFGRNTEAQFETVVVGPETITQVVSETGSVQSAEDINLSFARPGRVGQMLVRQGDRVRTGQVLATLEGGLLSAEYSQAEAALEREQLLLEDLFSDPTNADLGLTENAQTLAETTFDNAEQSLETTIRNLYVTVDDLVQAKVDQLFERPDTDSPEFGITITQGTTKYFIGGTTQEATAINAQRKLVESNLDVVAVMLAEEDLGDLQQVAGEMETLLVNTQNLLSSIADAINGYVAGDTTVQVIYEGYKTNISVSRSTINTSLTSLNTAQQAYVSARAALGTPQAELDFKTQDPTTNAVKLQEIRVKEAEARLAAVASQLSDARVTSPINGIVTQKFVGKGEVVGASTPVYAVISDDELEISVMVPEDDIAFVDVGDAAQITFDAFDDLELNASVVYISESAEQREGVSVFEVKLSFVQFDSRVKAGLSADVDVIANQKTNVVAIPNRAVLEEGEWQFVRILTGENLFRNQTVKTGFRGENGLVQITQGLREGDEVITFISDDDLAKLRQEQ